MAGNETFVGKDLIHTYTREIVKHLTCTPGLCEKVLVQMFGPKGHAAMKEAVVIQRNNEMGTLEVLKNGKRAISTFITPPQPKDGTVGPIRKILDQLDINSAQKIYGVRVERCGKDFNIITF